MKTKTYPFHLSRFLLATLIFLSACTGVGTISETGMDAGSEVDHLVAQGNEFLANENWDAAINEFDEALALETNTEAAISGIGLLTM